MRITNNGSTKFSGPVSISLYASTNNSTSSASLASDKLVNTISLEKVNLRAGASAWCGSSSRTRRRCRTAITTSSPRWMRPGPILPTNVTATPTTVSVAAARVDLAATFRAESGGSGEAGEEGSVVVIVRISECRRGRHAEFESVRVSHIDSRPGDRHSAGQPSARTIRLAPGRSIRVRLNFQAPPALVGGSYDLIASEAATTQLADANSATTSVPSGRAARDRGRLSVKPIHVNEPICNGLPFRPPKASSTRSVTK